MLISVVVPVYNVELYLRECVDSIINQNYPDLEIILVDDGSTDSSGNICEEYQKKDSRIKVIHKENGGLSDARNYGIDSATGEYITFVDSDDYVEVDYIEVLFSKLIEYNADISIASFSTLRDNKIINVLADSYYEKELLAEESIANQYKKYNCFNTSFVTAWGKLYKTSLFRNIRFPKGKKYEDEYTTYKLYIEVKRTIYINKELYVYRQREDSIINQKYSLRDLDILPAIKERITILEEKGYSTKDVKYFYLYLLAKNRYYLKKNNLLEEYNQINQEYKLIFKEVFFKASIKKKMKILLQYISYGKTEKIKSMIKF